MGGYWYWYGAAVGSNAVVLRRLGGEVAVGCGLPMLIDCANGDDFWIGGGVARPVALGFCLSSVGSGFRFVAGGGDDDGALRGQALDDEMVAEA